MTDDRIEVTASIKLADLLALGSVTIEIKPGRAKPEPEPLPPNSPPAEGDEA